MAYSVLRYGFLHEPLLDQIVSRSKGRRDVRPNVLIRGMGGYGALWHEGRMLQLVKGLLMFGLHVFDLFVMVAYLVAMIVIGLRVSKGIKDHEDFVMGGRQMGWWLQTFMNFGTGTSADTAVDAARETFRQGYAGLWLKLYVLFITPFYWITTVWLRRLRLSSMSELFRIRYESPLMEKVYALLGLLSFMATISISMLALQKTAAIIAVKPEQALSAEEQQAVYNFERLSALKYRAAKGELSDAEQVAYERLRALKVQGKVHAHISYINPYVFLPLMGVVILAYGLTGGLKAAALTDAVQGLLIIALSLLLLPTGLRQIGGFAELHTRVPESVFNLFGSAATSEYPWYYVVAVVLMGLTLVEVSPQNAQIMGSAKDEETARAGRVVGNFLKRFTLISWGFTGVIGYGLYHQAISDPDMLWGYMTRQLLAPGLIGLMIVCLLAALMSTADTFIISAGALFTESIYIPLFPGQSERQYLWAERLAAAVVLTGAILIALMFQDLLRLIRFAWALGLVFGAAYWAAILWRGATTRGAWAAILYTLVSTVVIGHFLAHLPGVTRMPFLTQMTHPHTEEVQAGASRDDVLAGRARYEGQRIAKTIHVAPTGIFFETVVPDHSTAPNSVLVGRGRFRTSLLIPALLGIDLRHLSKGALIAIGYYLDVVIPFLLLVVVSKLSPMNGQETLDQFYGRLHTPVRAGQDDAHEMALTRLVPTRFQHRKLFPKTHIEFEKPSRRDIVGFLLSWLAVGGVLVMMVALAKIGS
jgi:SSS family solute:Na+ symporter